MSQRNELVALAHGHGVTVTELARRFGISRKTAYKWLSRGGWRIPGGSLASPSNLADSYE